MATPAHWHSLHKTFHWLTLFLLVAVWGAVELHEFYAKGSAMREWWKMLHFSLGLTTLLVVIARLATRACLPRPALIGARWQALLSKAVHVLLYCALLAMPASGFLLRQFAGKEIEIFGLFSLPQFTVTNMDLAKQIAFIHKELIWNVLLALVAVHVIGALWHHWVDRDETLRRMLPGRKP